MALPTVCSTNATDKVAERLAKVRALVRRVPVQVNITKRQVVMNNNAHMEATVNVIGVAQLTV